MSDSWRLIWHELPVSKRAREQLLAAGLIGALLMIATDTAARSLAFPYQLPTGLFAALVGGPYLVVMLIRKPH